MKSVLRLCEICLVDHSERAGRKPNEAAPPSGKAEQPPIDIFGENRFKALQRELNALRRGQNIAIVCRRGTVLCRGNSCPRCFHCSLCVPVGGTLVQRQRLLEESSPRVVTESFVHQRKEQTHQNRCHVLQRDDAQVVENGTDLLLQIHVCDASGFLLLLLDAIVGQIEIGLQIDGHQQESEHHGEHHRGQPNRLERL